MYITRFTIFYKTCFEYRVTLFNKRKVIFNTKADEFVKTI